MQYSASDFRGMAREALRGKWGTAILLTILASFLGVATTASPSIEFKFESETGIVVELLCFIVPGIMAGYSYSMAHFIANDHPDMTANEVIAASKRMMYGHRFRLFCLEISFIGWALLSAFTLGIGTFVLAPYIETARAFFYQDLLENGMRIEEGF